MLASVALSLGLLIACQPTSTGGLGTGSGGDFVPGQTTPTDTPTATATLSAAEACAPSFEVTEESPTLESKVIASYAAGCQIYLVVEASYSMTCGALDGGHLLVDLYLGAQDDGTPTETSTPTEGETPSETPVPVAEDPDLEFFLFVENSVQDQLVNVQLGAGTFQVNLPLETIDRTEWTMDITLVDDLGYPSEVTTMPVSTTDLDVAESEDCASAEERLPHH